MARHRADFSGDLRDASITVQLSDTERQEIAARAAAAGQSVAAYVRARVFGGKQPAPAAGRDPQAIRHLANEVSRVGNNLNQLAKLAHQAGRFDQERTLRDIQDLVVAALERVIAL